MPARIPWHVVLNVDRRFDAVEAFFEKVDEAIKEIIAEQTKRAEDDYDDDGPGHEVYWQGVFEDTLARTLNYSTLAQTYALLDALLSQLCDEVQSALRLRFLRTDMKDQRELKTRIEYLQKGLGNLLAEDAFGGDFAAKLHPISLVRHRIVHANGEVGKVVPKNLDDALKKLGLGVADGYIELPTAVVRELTREARKWAEQVCEDVGRALEKNAGFVLA